jgi:uncharacterized protein (TIGR03067 family)
MSTHPVTFREGRRSHKKGVIKTMVVNGHKATVILVLTAGLMGVRAFAQTRLVGGQNGRGVVNPPPPTTVGLGPTTDYFDPALSGRWMSVKFQAGNGPRALDEETLTEVRITPDTMTFQYRGRAESMRYVVNRAETPHEIDLTPTRPAALSRSEGYRGIYRLAGDELTIRFTKNQAVGTARPMTFQGDGKQAGYRTYTLQRRTSSNHGSRHFGPLIEREVTGRVEQKTSFLDLDTGLHVEPHAAGADLATSLTLSDSRARVGLNLVAIAVADDKLEAATPAEVMAAVSDPSRTSKGRQQLGGNTRVYYFKTARGNMGVLQILPVRENQAVVEVLVRYKLIVPEKTEKM